MQLKPAPKPGSVSVVLATYNDERYIAECIESVLTQSYRDFDFVIVNDGSTDGTDEIIRSYTDPRIVCLVQDHQGTSAAFNLGFRQAKGQYIAIMNGDDVCDPRRLTRQRDFLRDQHAQVVTSWIEVIGGDSAPFDRPDLIAACNCTPAASQVEIMRKLFWTGNYLWPSSAMIDAALLRQIGGFSLPCLQLQDFMLWIKVVQRTQIRTLTEPLLKYRIQEGATNISQNPRNYVRAEFELQQIYRHFFEGISETLFRAAFGDSLRNPAFSGETEFAIECAFLFLRHTRKTIREVGIAQLFDLMRDEATVRVLTERYHLSLPDFFALENDPEHVMR